MSYEPFKVACVQCTSTSDERGNLDAVIAYIDDAAAHGADFISLPETVNHIDDGSPVSLFVSNDAFLLALRARAREHKIWLHIGSLKTNGGERLFNRGYLISQSGDIVAEYDKAHLFDVRTPEGVAFSESSRYYAGRKLSTARTPHGCFGLSICFDLRFSYMYRMLAQQGAQVLLIPAAFTYETGCHWEILLRARAIETQSFVIAANQTGFHSEKRRSFGHSMIIDPWGTVLSKADESQGVIYATVDVRESEKIRSHFPTLTRKSVIFDSPETS